MRILKLSVLWDSKQAEAGMAGLAATSDETATKIGKSGEDAGAKFSTGIEKGTSKAGDGLQKLGNTLGQWGIPFSGRIEKIGKDLGSIETRGKGVAEAFSAVGGVVTLALVGIAAEAVKVSDQFETAQATLETAVKNAGGDWDAYKVKVDAAYASAAKLGFENNDVAQGLTTLVTATNSPTKAINDLSTAENIARARHISLSDASAGLARILGGNTRQLQQWGINLDIGSGKLHSIQSAEEALQKAQLSQTHIQDEVNDGQIKGVNASYDQQNALLSVRNAQLNLTQSQQAIPDILDAINQRTQGMADAYGKTLPGELATARAEVHNLGTELGTALIPDIDKLLGLGGDILGFFDHSTLGAVALATAIGGPLAAAMLVFTANRVVSTITGLQKIGSGLATLATTVLEKTGIIDVAGREYAAAQATIASEVRIAQEAQVAGWETSSSAIDAILAEQEAMYREFGISTGESIEDAAAAFTGLDVTVGQSAASINASLAEASADAKAQMGAIAGTIETDGAAIEETNAGIGASFSAMLGPIGLAAAALAAFYEISKPTALGKNDVVSALTPQTLQSQLQTDIKQNIPYSLAGFQQALEKTKGYVKGEKLSVKGSTADLTGVPETANQKLLDQINKDAKTNTPGTSIPGLGGVPAIGGGTGATGLTAAQKALATLQANATKYLATLADDADPARNTSLASLRSKFHTDTDKASKLTATTLEDKLKAAGQSGLADKISKAFDDVGTDLQERIKSAAKAAGEKAAKKAAASLGNAALSSIQSETTDTDVGAIQNVVTPSGGLTGSALTAYLGLVNTGQEALAGQLVSVAQEAAQNLNEQLSLQQQAALTDQTTAQANALTTQTAIDQATSTQMVDSIQAAATAIADASKISGDISSAKTQGITDATQAGNDASAATVQAINDQTQIQVDQMAETGLYGLQLVAAQDKVALDQQVMIDHQAEAAATAHVDSVTASNNQLVASDQLALDNAQQAADVQAAADQATADATGIRDAINVQTAQAAADAAQAHADAEQWGSATESAQAQAGLQSADATLSAAQAQQSSDSASTAATIQQDQANAAKTIATLTAILNGDQSTASQTIALATQSLSQVTDTANVTEAKLSSLVTIANAAASQGSGGVNIYISGLPMDNAAAIGAAASYAYRYKT